MAGIIAGGEESELGDEEIFSIVVGNFPTIFDGLVQDQGTDAGVQHSLTGQATWNNFRAQQHQEEQEPAQSQASSSANRSRSRTERP
eukprot:7883206-Heterocapsa_arctica.AAC.1